MLTVEQLQELTTVDVVAYADAQQGLSALELVLLDRLHGAMEEIDLLVADLDNYKGEEALQFDKGQLDVDA